MTLPKLPLNFFPQRTSIIRQVYCHTFCIIKFYPFFYYIFYYFLTATFLIVFFCDETMTHPHHQHSYTHRNNRRHHSCSNLCYSLTATGYYCYQLRTDPSKNSFLQFLPQRIWNLGSDEIHIKHLYFCYAPPF